MTKEEKAQALEVRINKLRHRGDKNIKSPGVLRRLERELRNCKK